SPSENQENFIDPRHSHQIKFTQTDSSADVLDQVRGFADNIPEPLAYVDADGRFGFVNRAFAQLVSRTQLSIVNQPLEEFQKNVQISDIKHQFERAKSYESLIEERLLHLPDQTQRWIEMRWLLDRAEGPDSRIRGAYLICSDITENREARAAYEKNLEETERTLN
ncbi:MAG: PAS domain-containing protein, partial [Burkholderiales bacterium]|nr:PAS domain-containing protein [Burkholderiales bacterium]